MPILPIGIVRLREFNNLPNIIEGGGKKLSGSQDDNF